LKLNGHAYKTVHCSPFYTSGYHLKLNIIDISVKESYSYGVIFSIAVTDLIVVVLTNGRMISVLMLS